MRDFGEIVKDKGIPWVRHWIDATFEFSNNFVKSGTNEIDFEALGREEWEFRKALKTKDFSNNERAKYLWNEALNIHNRNSNNGKKSTGRPKKSPQDAPNGNAGVDMYDAGNGAASKSTTSCDTFTADGDIREDSLAKPDGSAITRNETRHIEALDSSANHYATRQAKNGDADTSDGSDESNTVSRNMRRVPQNEAPAHGFSGGRTAQGTMSRSPEAAAQSGKASALDSLPDKDGQSAKTRDNRASGRYAPPSCSPDDGKLYDKEPSTRTDDTQPEGLTGPSHGGSVASLDALESQARKSQRHTGGSSVRGMAKVAQPPVRPRAKNSRCPNSRDEFHAFVADNNLHEGLAEEWYAIHEAREWVDRDGNPIKDWRGALYNYCTKTEQKRRTA